MFDPWKCLVKRLHIFQFWSSTIRAAFLAFIVAELLIGSCFPPLHADEVRWRIKPSGRNYDFNSASPLQSFFSPDGKILAIICRDHSIRLWDLRTGREVRRLIGHGSTPTTLSFSPDGKRILSCAYHESPKGPFRVWSVATGECLYEQDCPPVVPHTHQCVYSPSGRYFVTETSYTAAIGGSVSWTIDAFDAQTFRKIKTVLDCRLSTSGLMFSADGEKLLVGYAGSIATQLVNFRTGSAGKLPTGFNKIVISSDGRYLAGNNGERELVIFDANSLTEIRRLRLPEKTDQWNFGTRLHSVLFHPDSRSVFAFSEWFWLQWSIESGTVIQCGRLEAGSERSIAISSDGQLLAETVKGMGVVLWDLEDNKRAAILRCCPVDGQWASETSDGFYHHSDSYSPVISPLPTGMTSKEYASEFFDPKMVQQNLVVNSTTIPLPSDTPRSVATNLGRLFVLAAGVSGYDDVRLNLQFSHADAEAIAAKFQQQKGLGFADVQTQVYVNKQATVTNLKEGLAWLSRSCTPNDVAVVFFSGHGLQAERGLYYVTHEANLNGMQYTCLNWETVAAELQKTKAKQILLLTDTCHAGAFAKSQLVPQQEIAAKLALHPSVTVFCSSRGEEQSLEHQGWQHGAFSYALLEAIDGKADRNDDKQIAFSEFTQYIAERVEKLTNGTQHPIILQRNASNSDLVIANLAK
jgi:WD40 repeat protein